MNRTRRQAWLITGGSVAALVLALGVLWQLVERQTDVYADALQQTERQIARLQGIRDAEEALRQRAEQVNEQWLPAMVYDPRRPAHQDLSLLRSAQNLLRDAGLEINRSQTGSPQEYGPFRAQRVAFQGRGTLEQIVAALGTMRRHEPVIRVEGLRLVPVDPLSDEITRQQMQVFLDVAWLEALK